MSANRAADPARTIVRVLVRLAAPGALLAMTPDGRGYGVYRGADRRRRPVLLLSHAQTQTLLADGAIAAAPNGFALTPAGRARAQRALATPGETFHAQHAPIVARGVIDADGDVRMGRGLDPMGAVRRLAHLRDGDGRPWLSATEMAAASRLRADWDQGQIGLTPMTDWSAPPTSGGARGPGDGRQAALARGLDARARVETALGALAAPLRRAVTAICLEECGLEQVERREGWPPRSAKVALKLALAQLASTPR
ncbi:MAG: hypothetical protein GC206_06100 [Alphaproteobacteria bacterium]|nr:hypothetical protein [Alphaproteobacteria bacterium]